MLKKHEKIIIIIDITCFYIMRSLETKKKKDISLRNKDNYSDVFLKKRFSHRPSHDIIIIFRVYLPTYRFFELK